MILNEEENDIYKIKQDFERNFIVNLSSYISNVGHQEKIKKSTLKFNYYNDLHFLNGRQCFILNYDINEFNELNHNRLSGGDSNNSPYIFYSFNKDVTNPICVILLNSNIILNKYNQLKESQQIKRKQQQLASLKEKDEIIDKIKRYIQQLELIEQQLDALNRKYPPDPSSTYYGRSYQEYYNLIRKDYEEIIKEKKELETSKNKIEKYLAQLRKKLTQITKEEKEKEEEVKIKGKEFYEWLKTNRKPPM